jgi:hypothetical protein
MRLNRVQAKAVYQLYKGNPDGSPSYLHFRHRVFPLFGEPEVAMIVYVGIFVGIEPDGYVHS